VPYLAEALITLMRDSFPGRLQADAFDRRADAFVTSNESVVTSNESVVTSNDCVGMNDNQGIVTKPGF